MDHTGLPLPWPRFDAHYDDVIMRTLTSQTTSLTIVYSNVSSGADHRKHQSSASLPFVRGIHRSPVNSPHKGPVTWKMFPFDASSWYVTDLETQRPSSAWRRRGRVGCPPCTGVGAISRCSCTNGPGIVSPCPHPGAGPSSITCAA